MDCDFGVLYDNEFYNPMQELIDFATSDPKVKMYLDDVRDKDVITHDVNKLLHIYIYNTTHKTEVSETLLKILRRFNEEWFLYTLDRWE